MRTQRQLFNRLNLSHQSHHNDINELLKPVKFLKDDSTPSKSNHKKKIIISTKNKKHNQNQISQRERLLTSIEETLNIKNRNKQNVKYHINRLPDSKKLLKNAHKIKQSSSEKQDPFYLETSRQQSDFEYDVTNSITYEMVSKDFVSLKVLANVMVDNLRKIQEGIKLISRTIYKPSFSKLSQIRPQYSIIPKRVQENASLNSLGDNHRQKLFQKMLTNFEIFYLRHSFQNIQRAIRTLNLHKINRAAVLLNHRETKLSLMEKELSVKILKTILYRALSRSTKQFFKFQSNTNYGDNLMLSTPTYGAGNYHAKSYSFAKHS